MRRTALLLTFLLTFLVACGGHGSPSTLPKPSASPPIKPASDLADARANAPRADPGDTGLTARDPRVVDLDIIRIRASGSGIGGDPELTSVASADLFKLANASAKAGTTKDAIARYRQLISEFPDSQYAPVSLFNIAAVYDHQGDLANTISTLDELLKTYPQSRESIDEIGRASCRERV